MNTRPLPASLLVALVAALLAVAVPLREAFAQNPTDTKIRLMAEALRARDAGDLAGAQKALAQLTALTPDDRAVQRLKAEIEAQATAQQAALAQQAAAEKAAQEAARRAPAPAEAPRPVAVAQATPAKAAPAMIDVRIPEPGQAAAAPATPTPEQEAEALARAEAARLDQLVMEGQARLAAARSQLRNNKPDDAIATVDAVLATLPENPATQKLSADLKKEKAAALLERAQILIKKGDNDGARAALAAHGRLAPADTRSAALERQLVRAETKPAAVAADPGYVAERANTAQLVAKGRAQYVAGDLDGAQETFRAIEAQEPDNTVAKGFLLRIAEEKTEMGALNREKTRAQLLEEVSKSWQRPGIYQERPREVDQAAAIAPLAKKLSEITLPSVSWTRATIGDVVAALSAISEEFDRTSSGGVKGVNVVLIDPSNKNPQVTLTLRNATLKRVLDFVTEAIGYQYEVQADAVVVRPGGETTTLETQFFPVTRATVLRMTGMAGSTSASANRDPFASPEGNTSEATPAPAGGEAAAMKAFLQQAGVSFTVEGSSLAYDGSAIIVTQTARNNERIRNILARYNDVRQVEIEAKFMEVQEGALEELGVNWNLSRRGIARVNPTTGAPVLDANGRQIFDPQETYSTDKVTRPLFNAFPSTSNQNALTISEVANSANTISVPVSPAQIPGSVQLGAVATALGSITGFVGEFDVTAAVRALSQKQGTDLLSSPRLTVLSGNPANITVAQELRYPQSYGEIQSQVGSGTGGTGLSSAGVTITAGTPQEFTSRNVGVELKVTPTVEEDDYSISLDLNPRVTEFEGFVEYGGPSVAISSGVTVTVPPGFYQPIFSVRDISTKVTIWDGATLVMGGLTREEVKKVNDKVPFFGDIPLLGRLFRSKGESAQKRNLLIFVTANLVSPGGSPKKQNLKSTPANSLFQNPTIVTPASAEPRTRSGAK
ncbi:MAG: type II secretory pathway, component PulD [Verrucomicrobia bacterium]|nr:type II secretory pathway, component PulD [Verrucomicrobiota bacterium]